MHLRLLIIDDNPADRSLMRRLKRPGHCPGLVILVASRARIRYEARIAGRL